MDAKTTYTFEEKLIKAKEFADAINEFEGACADGLDASLRLIARDATTTKAKTIFIREGTSIRSSDYNLTVPADELYTEIDGNANVVIRGYCRNKGTTFETFPLPVVKDMNVYIPEYLQATVEIDGNVQELISWYHDYLQSQDETEEDITEEESKN